MLPETRKARSDLGVAARLAKLAATPDRLAALADARTEYRTVALAEHIKRTVDAAPQLTPEQIDRLAVLLRSGPDAA